MVGHLGQRAPGLSPPDFLDLCLEVLERLLQAGNQVLMVSKPRLACIQTLCTRLEDYRNRAHRSRKNPAAHPPIYQSLNDRPKVRWKESYKKVLGLELAMSAGLEV